VKLTEVSGLTEFPLHLSNFINLPLNILQPLVCHN